VLFDNEYPRYLPHLAHPGVLQMGLAPLRDAPWIETDNHLQRYRGHKLRTRERLGDRAYRATAGSLPAQQELASSLLHHLVRDQPDNYRLEGNRLHCAPGNFVADINAEESLWNCSLWVADDLVIMEQIDGRYCLTAASLCSPSHWRLEEKFGQPLAVIHDPIPRFSRELTPSVDRFFRHLRPEHPVVRFNWSLQTHDELCQRPELEHSITCDSPLYYRTERQSLRRLPRTGAIAFTIRVYLHPLETLHNTPGALAALLAAIEATPPDLAKYKGFDELRPSLARYREPGLDG
jgi:hypothetical protein